MLTIGNESLSELKKEAIDLILKLNPEQLDDLIKFITVSNAANEEQRAELDRLVADGSRESIRAFVQELAKTILPDDIY